MPARRKTGRHGLTLRVGKVLAGINPNNRFAYVCRLSDKSFINNCFACKNDRWITNNIFSTFFQKVFFSFRELIEFCISRFVCKCLPGLVKYNQALTYRYLCHGKKQSFFALLLKLGQHLFCYTSAKSL